jgi:hypothetical protein
MDTRPATDWEDLVHRTIREAIASASAGASAVTDLTFEFQDISGNWMTSVEPHHPEAASMYVVAEPDNELNLTVGRTWIEVWGEENPVRWLRELTEAVVAGRLEEAAGSSIRAYSRIGVIGGGEFLFLPWRWHPIRRYAPYAPLTTI